MLYEIPSVVTLVVNQNDTQTGFINRIYKEAARIAGLPLREQIDFAGFMLKLPLSQEELDKLFDIKKEDKLNHYRIVWNKDPTPKDKTAEIQDYEFNKLRGRWFSITLNSNIKNELAGRQVYYVLGGRVLGSMTERAKDDVITVDLNIVYEKSQYSEVLAKEVVQPLVDVAIQCYGVIQIKFNVVWTQGEGSFEENKITAGRKEGFVNVFLSKSKLHNSTTRTDAKIDKNRNITLKDIFLSEGQFKNRSFYGSDLAHELAHKFGIATYGFKIWGTDIVAGNFFDDIALYLALGRMWTGTVIKYIDWEKPLSTLGSSSVRISPEFKPTIFDLLRAGARKLGRKA
jgi:hypothetical protein